MAFGLQLDPKFWFFPGLYNYAIVYVASIFGFEDLTVNFARSWVAEREDVGRRAHKGRLECGLHCQIS